MQFKVGCTIDNQQATLNRRSKPNACLNFELQLENCGSFSANCEISLLEMCIQSNVRQVTKYVLIDLQLNPQVRVIRCNTKTNTFPDS